MLNTCGGRRVVASERGAIRRTDVEGYVESFALRFIMRFFGAAAEVGGVVPLRVALEMRVRLFPNCAWHSSIGGKRGSWVCRPVRSASHQALLGRYASQTFRPKNRTPSQALKRPQELQARPHQ